MIAIRLAAILLLLSPIPASLAQAPPTASEVVANVVKAAEALVASCSADQRKALVLTDEERLRKRWSNLPVGIYRRQGLRVGDLSQEQRAAMMALLGATLSEAGLQQVIDNMNGDEVLKAQGRGRRQRFGKDEYYVAILGQPSISKPWMWQFGGHHLAINATIAGARVTLSPSLTGGQPMSYVYGGKRVRQLAGELDAARALIASLSPEQAKAAVLADRFDDLRFGPGREGVVPRQEGVKGAKLSAAQQKLLLALIGARIGILNATHAAARMKRIAKDLDRTWFSWRGPTAKGQAASYRIQGPTVLIELAPQYLGGKPTEHIHAMLRDPTNDYGAAIRKGK